MADDPQKPADPAVTPPIAAGDKPTGPVAGEPLKGEVSRTDSPSAGQSAAPAADVRTEPPAAEAKPAAAAKPAAPAAKPAASAAKAPAPPAKAPAAPAGEAHVPKAAAAVGPSEPPPPADLAPPAFITSLQAAIPGSVLLVSYWVGDWTIVVPTANAPQILRYLRDAPDAQFDACSDVTATDWPLRAERFDIVYCLYSTRHRHRVRVKLRAAEHEPVASVVDIWPAANWLEREMYDMFGVNLTGHPDRRRILMPEDWQGFPQRKDYPLEGPGELLLENPLEWLKLRQAREQADIE